MAALLFVRAGDAVSRFGIPDKDLVRDCGDVA